MSPSHKLVGFGCSSKKSCLHSMFALDSVSEPPILSLFLATGGLKLDQGRLRLTQPCGASFDVWLQRNLTWARAPEYALQLTVASYPVVSATGAPPLAATDASYSAMLKYKILCLRAVRNGSAIDVEMQSSPSIYDSEAIKAPFLFAVGDNGVFWSGNGASPDYLLYQLRPKSGFCEESNDAVAMALDFTERFLPLSARLVISSDGSMYCVQSGRVAVSLFCCGPIAPGRYALWTYAAGAGYDYVVFAPFDMRVSVTRSITLSTSITASRTPSASVTPRPLVYETTQGYVNLVVSRLLAGASGEELLWLGPTGRVATTLASIPLDPRGGLDAGSRQAQWCTLLSDADRLRYSIVFANYGVNSNKWYGNGTTVTTTASTGGSSEWFELSQVAPAGSRNVSAMFGGPLYQLAISGGCVSVGGTTAEITVLPCGSDGTALYLLIQNPTQSATPTISVTPSVTLTSSVTPSVTQSSSTSTSPTASASRSLSSSLSLTSTITASPSVTATTSPLFPVVLQANGKCLTRDPVSSYILLCDCGLYGSLLDRQFVIPGPDVNTAPIYWQGDSSQCLVTNSARLGGYTTVDSQTLGCNTKLISNKLKALDGSKFWSLVTRADANANCNYVRGPDGTSNYVNLQITP
eukprot:g25046.t1